MDRLRAMEYFQSIARTQSFSETARLFGVSATSVSRMVTEFEAALNVQLLLRSTRQVILTEAGQEYAAQLEGILWSIREAHNNVTAIRSAPKGMLRVHARTMFGVGVLPPLMAEFRAQYPEIRIELVLSESKADLRRDRIDIDFRISPPQEAGLKRRMLFKSERYLVASPDYVRSMAGPRRPAEIREHQLLAYARPGDQCVWRFMTGDGIEEIPFEARHATNNGMVLLDLARLGEGIALLDDYTVARDIGQGRLVRLLPDFKVTNTTFEEGMFATLLDTPSVPAKIRLFLDFIADRVSGPSLRFSAFRERAASGGAPDTLAQTDPSGSESGAG